MGLIQHFLRVFFRSHFRPINPRIAKKWETNSSILYFLTAWTTFGASVYYFKTKNKDNEGSPYDTARVLTPYDAVRKFGSEGENTIIRIKGISGIEKEVLTLKEAAEKH